MFGAKYVYHIAIMNGITQLGTITDTNKQRALAKAKAFARELKDKKIELVTTVETKAEYDSRVH